MRADVRFVIAMAVRETRSAWRRLLFFFLCIAVGVGAIVSLRSVIQSVRQALRGQARALIAADVVVSTDRPWSRAVEEAIARRSAAPAVLGRTDSVELATMVRPASGERPTTRMIELRAVQAGFPFYGSLTLQDGRAYSHALLQGRGALVRPELLTELGVSVGDALSIGRETFTIRGVIASEPGRSIDVFSLGPRVLVDLADLPATGLLAFGSRSLRQTLLRVSEPDLEPLVRQLSDDVRGEFVRVRSYRDAEERTGENLGRAEDYLSLVGLVIVVLGGIAVSSVTRVFVRQKIRSVAVLKCLGAGTRQVVGIYLLQSVVLGLLGSLIGLALAAIALSAVPVRLRQLGELTVAYGVTAQAAAQGLGIGVLVSALFAVVPLMEIRHVKPSLLLRRDLVPGRRTGWGEVVSAGALGLALVALAIWQAASLRVGLGLSVGFAVLVGVLHLAGQALIRLAAPLARSRWFPLRQAVLHLSRPGNQTRVVLLAVGLGCFFLMGVRGLQGSLLSEFAIETGEQTPDMILLDIQPDQVGEVRAFLNGRVPPERVRLIPVVRARVAGVRGKQVRIDTVEDVRGRGSLAREYTVTDRDHLEPNEQIVRGRFWGPQRAGEAGGAGAEVSIEQSLHDRFGLDVGDIVRFDVLGRAIEATVTSVRQVEWRDARNGGFMFVFRPGVLDQAPRTFVGAVRGVDQPQWRARFRDELVREFVNVSVIDLTEILQNVRSVFEAVTLAISGVGALVLFNGALILIGAVAMTKFQRVYEAAVFKTLGATGRLIGTMLAVEYGVLGTLAGAVGCFAALALNWGICRYGLDIPWHPAPLENLAGTVATAALVIVVGVVASADVLRRKPLGTLRAE